MSKVEQQEEQYVLRVVDPELADKIRKVLREEENIQGSVELTFPENGRQGHLQVEGKEYNVNVLDLPTLVESYKTYDDTNLVKTGDIGQMLVVGGEVPQGQIEAIDGVTPPMRKARARHLRKKPDVTPDEVSHVEKAIFDILNGYAPAHTEFYDIEEEYTVDEATGTVAWKQVAKGDKGEKKKERKEKAPKADKALPAAEGAAGAGEGPSSQPAAD
uniref:TAFII55 protein conserved region domain-containing protein n=1 Tax=Chlamydomonas leiostraca TaxID=1034604 RepID=A0A7S0S221_9CHLO|mmetsp:Transcript_4153/g.10386  ORF Transcript_4153/g.10386 Transcript_4153/m.10386 type:complete len:216 (+) Transcript_4153:67-714(+)|eukprot:CAMPEP_0202860560 /NCGR_PEP_ID=MMETSP1391-20130828/2223_1 /ASSEMBLY_ACC=CAM_ASM_000867 /TAXON_ID=1034604 /ORGANISM="Chlamydomonas leiostraca, Strain SAG 11-49" /LENGTH=215 /DNA_ID=CAMNT_0049539753 /DNA_START=32 /DNA_END=679 /DNA_ORIENTATION=-